MCRNRCAGSRRLVRFAGAGIFAAALFPASIGIGTAAQRENSANASPTSVRAQATAVLLNVEGEELAKTGQFLVSGGQVTAQSMGGFGTGWSGDGQLFWSGGSVGAVLNLTIDVPAAAAYALELYPTRAPDYGQIKIQVDGQDAPVTLDAYSPRVMQPTPRQVGKFSLTPGAHTVSFMIVGKNTMATNYLVGIDRMRLYPSGPFVETNSTLAGRSSQNTGLLSPGATNPQGSQTAQSTGSAGPLPQSTSVDQQNQVKTVPGNQGPSMTSGVFPAQLDKQTFLTQLRSGVTKEFMDQVAQFPQPSLRLEVGQEKDLAEIVSAIKSTNVDAALKIWSERFGEMGDMDLSAIVFFLFRESYIDTVEDLKYMAEKIKAFNDTKKKERELLSNLQEERARATNLTRGVNLSQLNGRISKIEESLSGIDREITALENGRKKALEEQERLIKTISQMAEIMTRRASFPP